MIDVIIMQLNPNGARMTEQCRSWLQSRAETIDPHLEVRESWQTKRTSHATLSNALDAARAAGWRA